MPDPFNPPAPPAPVAAALACPHCERPMQVLPLQGHYGRDVLLQCCEPCRLLWFDSLEAVTLTGRAWLALLRRLQRAPPATAPWRGGPLPCPACRAALTPSRARLPGFDDEPAARECGAGHGHLQSVGQLVLARALVLPLAGPPALTGLANGPRECLNCGAALAEGAGRCPRCAGPLALIELPRLAAALRPRPNEPLPAAAQTIAPLPAWAALGPLLEACEAEWWAQQQAPRPRVWAGRREADPEPWRTTSLARLIGNFAPRGAGLWRWAAVLAALLLWWWWRRR